MNSLESCSTALKWHALAEVHSYSASQPKAMSWNMPWNKASENCKFGTWSLAFIYKTNSLHNENDSQLGIFSACMMKHVFLYNFHFLHQKKCWNLQPIFKLQMSKLDTTVKRSQKFCYILTVQQWLHRNYMNHTFIVPFTHLAYKLLLSVIVFLQFCYL